MSEAVRIDPETGFKVFNTRAAKASEKIAGKGYSVVTDQKLVELPKLPAGATFNGRIVANPDVTTSSLPSSR